ncbi:MAG TPA: nucleoside triphosphate pyrophosphohydrolase [Cytophagales bacterium]|nr:nucleoside triphosphate pyrophosphohydrolase [Cytophagales bacterium]HRR08840.1 nucleoside triphosphate pyrophosphohydrolase [Rhodothermales bacterium]
MKIKKIEIPLASLAAESSAQAYADFIQIVRRLRKECPWDREQTHESIRHLIIEEAYEAVEAIEKGDWEELRKELGDLFLHIVFHGILAEEKSLFTVEGVLRGISEKLIRRHPHVYGDLAAEDAQSVLENWEKIKQQENPNKKSVLSGVPAHLPGLLQAHRIQEKAAGVGFDFPNYQEAFLKIKEELEEYEEIMSDSSVSMEDKEMELGDLLFSITNHARIIGLVPENAIRRTNKKFIDRFSYIEKKISDQGKNIADISLDEMDLYWDEAKTFHD